MRKVISLNQGWKLYQNGKCSEVNLYLECRGRSGRRE